MFQNKSFLFIKDVCKKNIVPNFSSNFGLAELKILSQFPNFNSIAFSVIHSNPQLYL